MLWYTAGRSRVAPHCMRDCCELMKGSGAGRHGRTERMLAEGFHLLVSLPRNDIELARAALEAGADGLKVHIGLHHHASGLVTGPLDEEDLEVGRHISGRRKIIVLNKCDLGVAVDRGRVRRVFGEGRIVEVSALTGGGTDELRSAIVDELLGDRGGGSEGVMVTRERHADCLRKARSYLESSISALRRGLPLECVASDVREAASSLGEILGETTPEDILDRIFSEFCVGK